ncbi:hypothetical protein [Ichthyenterobacterium magnum]|uniref:RteC protein n=1 Tax=Ichthyenterobacterium magnum TaxID=1230530 RepID=A0A420DFV6_9FLAO|nr:hypothetical protein [Ichthyenterobacterium magnum]RKE91908.1 hypothetical protein BXY80_2337 [Ichthyenterobacterium magnum]
METTILNQIDTQLQFITRLLERDISNGSVINDYYVNETKSKIFDWSTLKNFLTVTSFAKLNYLDEIVFRTEKFIELYNGFDNAIIKKFEKKFVYESEFRAGYTIYDFRMILINENEIRNLPNNTDNQRHTHLNKRPFNNYTLHDFAKKCDNIRAVILNFYPSLAKETENPYSDIFKGNDNKNFLVFEAYTENHIIDWYSDFSFLFQKMKEENRLHNIKHLYFMEWLKKNNYITEKVFDLLLGKTTFSKKYNSAQRINNYNLIVNDIFKTTS